jgi:hypothetical protein
VLGAEEVAPDPAEPVDSHPNSHHTLLPSRFRPAARV